MPKYQIRACIPAGYPGVPDTTHEEVVEFATQEEADEYAQDVLYTMFDNVGAWCLAEEIETQKGDSNG